MSSAALVVLAAALLASHAHAEPVAVAVVLDTSGSIGRGEFERTRALCVALLEGLPPGSAAALFTFDDHERMLLPWTSASQSMAAALAAVHPTGRFTALHDALFSASRQLRDSPRGRKVLLLLTDGRDEGSTLTLEDALRVAQESGFPVFTVGIGRVEERVLKRIAKLTDGTYLPLASAERGQLAVAIGNVQQAPGREAPAVPTPAASPTEGAAAVPLPTPPIVRTRGPLLAAGTTAVVLLLLAGIAAFRRRSPPLCPTCGRALSKPMARCAPCERAGDAAVDSVPSETPSPTTPLRRPAVSDPTPLSETILARLSSTEEYLEKTVMLKERSVLVVTKGPGSGRVFPLSDVSSTSIGRAKANDIVLDDTSVSSEHCRIRPEDGGFVVHDLKSTNGTYVNEKRVSHHPLTTGDILKIGETSLQLRLDQQRAAS